MILRILYVYSTGLLISPTPLKIGGCATYMKLTRYFIIFSCPQFADKDTIDQGKIYVSTRQTFEAIFEIAGASSYALFGTDI